MLNRRILCLCFGQIVKFEDVWRLCPDAKTLSSLYLYDKLLAEGKVPRLC
jgi:hypothetical protein